MPDCDKVDISLEEPRTLKFRAESNSTKYGFDMELFGEIVKEASRWNTKGRNVILNLVKKDIDAEFWTRLTESKNKNQKIQVDWTRWADEDDEQKDAGADFDPSAM